MQHGSPIHRQQIGYHTAFPVIVIGASTGGPQIIDAILETLNKNGAFPQAALLIVQHMPGVFTTRMTERLARANPGLLIQEAADGAIITPGVILIAPGDHNVRVVPDGNGRVFIRLNDEPNALHVTPSIDDAMESAAQTFGPKTFGVLLSGMGQDGARGMQMIRAVGGETIVQDPATCVVDSMVQYAIGCDGAGLILRPERIPAYLLCIASSSCAHNGHL